MPFPGAGAAGRRICSGSDKLLVGGLLRNCLTSRHRIRVATTPSGRRRIRPRQTLLTNTPKSDVSKRDSRAGGVRWLAAALAVALTLQIITVARSPLTSPDSIGFVQYARQLGETPLSAITEHTQHPGYPLLILAAHEVTGPLITGDAWMAAARLACGLCGLICVALVWLITRQAADAATANVAAVLFALLPSVRQNAADALSDQPHLMLYLGAVCLVCAAAARRSLWRFLAAGAVSGAAFWVRPEGLSVAVAAALCVSVLPAWRARLGTRRAVMSSGAVLLAAAMMVTPYVLISGRLTGKLAAKPGWWQPRASVAPPGPLPSKSSVGNVTDKPVAAPIIPLSEDRTPWNDPWPSALLAGICLFVTRLAENFNGILLIPLLIGIPLAARRVQKTTFTFFLLLGLSQVGLLLLLYRLGGYIDRRHQFPLLAILMPPIGMGALAIVEWIRATRLGPRGAAWALWGLAVCVLAILAPRAVQPLHQSHQHQLAAVAWIHAHGRPGDSVGSTATEVVYHASLDGRLHAGSVLHEGHPIEADGPLLRNTFLVVELNGQNQLPEWSHWIPPEFTPVKTIHGDSRLCQRDIVIYQRGEIVETADQFPASR